MNRFEYIYRSFILTFGLLFTIGGIYFVFEVSTTDACKYSEAKSEEIVDEAYEIVKEQGELPVEELKARLGVDWPPRGFSYCNELLYTDLANKSDVAYYEFGDRGHRFIYIYIYR